MRKACRNALADYELYVAKFYLERQKPWSARSRLEKVVTQFEDVPTRWRKGALLLVSTYLLMDKSLPDDIEPLPQAKSLAKQVAQRLKARYPNSRESSDPMIADLL